MPVDVKYRTTATAKGGRDGEARTSDGSFQVKLSTPKELGGAGGPGNNPEQLFAAGYAACFIGAMKFVAAQGGQKVPDDTTVTSTVGCPGAVLSRTVMSAAYSDPTVRDTMSCVRCAPSSSDVSASAA